jgi:glycosyltransferase involved in cell wall biosynthesis
MVLIIVNKILIVVPAATAKGGISNYYQVMKKYFNNQIVYVTRGSRNYPHQKFILIEIMRLIKDYLYFFIRLFDFRIKLVQTSTALGKKSVKRDGLYILLAKLLNKKVIVFYRGWDINYENKINRDWFFKKIFLNSNSSIVLSRYQYDWLKKRKVKKIYMGTTAVDDMMLKNINEEKIVYKFKCITSRKINLLFLARLEKEKGIFELIDAFNNLTDSSKYNLIIAGSGRAEDRVRRKVDEYKLPNVIFKGFVEKEKKITTYNKADIYIFPSYTEGMPNSVLEAMAFGLPVLTTKVGGLVDFFEEGKNGFFIEKYSSDSIVEKIHELVNNKDLMLEIALHNHKYAQKHFLASKVAERNMKIFNEVVNEE